MGADRERDGVVFLPPMSGSGYLVVDPRSRDSFVGLTGIAPRGDMLSAVIEGLD